MGGSEAEPAHQHTRATEHVSGSTDAVPGSGSNAVVDALSIAVTEWDTVVAPAVQDDASDNPNWGCSALALNATHVDPPPRSITHTAVVPLHVLHAGDGPIDGVRPSDGTGSPHDADTTSVSLGYLTPATLTMTPHLCPYP